MISNYRHNLSIFIPVIETDEYGDGRETYQHLMDVRGNIEPLNGKEHLSERGITSEISHKVYLRFIPNVEIKPSYILTYNNREFDIQAVINDNEMNRYLTIYCLEKPKQNLTGI
jgi:SPP1 family predicted phage head-tail adaptor